MTEAFRSFQPTEATVPLWASLLAEYEATDVQAALVDYLRTGKFAPVPADIIQRCEAILKSRRGELSPDQLWPIALRAAALSNYNNGRPIAIQASAEHLIKMGVPESQALPCLRAIKSLGQARLSSLDPEAPEFSFARKDFLLALESESEHAETHKVASALAIGPAIKNLFSNVKVIQ